MNLIGYCSRTFSYQIMLTTRRKNRVLRTYSAPISIRRDLSPVPEYIFMLGSEARPGDGRTDER